MNFARLERRNATASAMSSGSLNSPNGMVNLIMALIWNKDNLFREPAGHATSRITSATSFQLWLLDLKEETRLRKRTPLLPDRKVI